MCFLVAPDVLVLAVSGHAGGKHPPAAHFPVSRGRCCHARLTKHWRARVWHGGHRTEPPTLPAPRPGPASRTPGVWHWEGEDSHVSPRPALQDEVAPSLAKEMTAERHPGLPRGGRAGGGTPRTDAWAGRGCAPQPAGPRGPAACVLSDDFHPSMALRLQKDVFKDSPTPFFIVALI